MDNKSKRTSFARIFSFIVLLGLIPAWFFYIGIKYAETKSVISDRQDELHAYLNSK